MGPLILVKNFPVVVDQAQTFRTDWTPMDSEFENGTIHVHCQTITPTGASTGIPVVVETSFDTVESNPIGTTINVFAPGSQSAGITQNIGPMVRLKLTTAEAFPMWAILSVWLQPKST